MNFIDEIKSYFAENPSFEQIAIIIGIILLAYVSYLITRNYLLRVINKIALKSKNQWDDVFVKNKIFDTASKLVPLVIIYNFSNIVKDYESLVSTITQALMIFIVMRVFDIFLNCVNEIYQTYEISKGKPIKGFLQIAKIVFYVLGSVVIVSVLIGKSPLILLSGIGALTAVLLLIFKDTILSLVASIQLSSDNMINIGDWITMKKYDADGDVIDIALHTVKVQNFDKTITTIPTYKLMSESFKNWRGMVDSGGRRISRSVNIDIGTIKFLDDEMLLKFKSSKVLGKHMDSVLKDLEDYNKKSDSETEVFGKRRLTNIGTFRAYLNLYLKMNPQIHDKYTFLVRQLAPTDKGLPIQIYVFTTDNNWINYESIQSDIFDHILAIVPEFNLKVYQDPTGGDFRGTIINE